MLVPIYRRNEKGIRFSTIESNHGRRGRESGATHRRHQLRRTNRA